MKRQATMRQHGRLLTLLRYAWASPCSLVGVLLAAPILLLGGSAHTLCQLRAHEQEHVRQYERWGVVFFLAYPASSLIQLLRGRHPYWLNHFEVQARALCEQRRADLTHKPPKPEA